MIRRHGFTLIEVLVALFLLSVMLAGLIGLWSFGFNTTRRSQRTGVGYNIARHEVERLRTIGFRIAPEGHREVYYDVYGQPTAGLGQYLASIDLYTIPDSTGHKTMKCLRQLGVTVTSQATGEKVFATSSYLTQDGL